MAKKVKVDEVTLSKIEYAKACGNLMVQFTKYCIGSKEAQKTFCEVFSQGVTEKENQDTVLKLCLGAASGLTTSIEAQKKEAEVVPVPEKAKKENKAKAPATKAPVSKSKTVPATPVVTKR